MSLINQVLRDLDARGAAGRADRYNPWSPDAGRTEDARFLAYPASLKAGGPGPGGTMRRGTPARRSAGAAWRQGLLVLLAGVLLAMMLAASWAPRLAPTLAPALGPQDAALAAAAALPSAVSATVPLRLAEPMPAAATGARRAPATAASTLPAPAALARVTPSSPRPAPAEPPSPAQPAPPGGSPTALAALAVEHVPPPSAGVPRKTGSAAAATVPAAATASAAAGATSAAAPSALAATTALPGEAGTVEKKLTPMTAAQRAQASYAQAVESAQAGRPVQALAQATEALRLQPGHAAARHLAAILLHETARTDQAVELLREGLALAVDPRPNGTHETLALLMARLQAHQGLPEAAVATLDRHQLHSLEAEGLRAGLWSQLRRYKQAIQAYQATLQKQPGQVTWWLGLAVALEGDGQTALARQTFARVQAMGVADPELGAYVAQRLKALE